MRHRTAATLARHQKREHTWYARSTAMQAGRTIPYLIDGSSSWLEHPVHAAVQVDHLIQFAVLAGVGVGVDALTGPLTHQPADLLDVAAEGEELARFHREDAPPDVAQRLATGTARMFAAAGKGLSGELAEISKVDPAAFDMAGYLTARRWALAEERRSYGTQWARQIAAGEDTRDIVPSLMFDGMCSAALVAGASTSELTEALAVNVRLATTAREHYFAMAGATALETVSQGVLLLHAAGTSTELAALRLAAPWRKGVRETERAVPGEAVCA